MLSVFTQKGETFLKNLGIILSTHPENGLLQSLQERQAEVKELLSQQNQKLPGYEETSKLIKASQNGLWKKYAADCVSCGACSAICPTCSCFLLIDRPGFEKIRQLDTCQYPGFERVAGGEDSLGQLGDRFQNRYLCKYVYKPVKYELKACTGCGRCIETCIGRISKNELFMELSNQSHGK